jgi:hypothetical protein
MGERTGNGRPSMRKIHEVVSGFIDVHERAETEGGVAANASRRRSGKSIAESQEERFHSDPVVSLAPSATFSTLVRPANPPPLEHACGDIRRSAPSHSAQVQISSGGATQILRALTQLGSEWVVSRSSGVFRTRIRIGALPCVSRCQSCVQIASD